MNKININLFQIKPLLSCVFLVMFSTTGQAGTMATSASEIKQNDNPVLFQKGKQEFTLNDLKSYIASRPVQRSEAMASRAGLRNVVEEMAMGEALKLEGPARGYQPLPDQNVDSPAYLMSVFRKIVPPCDPVSEEDAQNFYRIHREKFTTPPLVRTERIFFSDAIKVDNLSAKDYLVEKASNITAGSETFESLVEKSKAANFSSEKIGDTGFIPMEGSEPIVKALSTAKVGELVGPIISNGFVYLFKVTDRREAVWMEWDDARKTAADIALRECNNSKLKSAQSQLFKKYDIKINQDLINSL